MGIGGLGAGLVLICQTGAPVEVGGETACPRPGDVAARLEALLAHVSTAEPTDHAVIRHEGSVLRIELRRADGSLLVERRLSPVGSCVQMAEEVAVVIAVWEARSRPGLKLPMDLADRSPAPSLPPDRVSAAPLTAEAGVSLLVSPAADGTGWGGQGDLAVGLAHRPLAARLVLLGIMARDQAIGPGQASWTRFAVGLGPRFRLARSRLNLDLHLEPLLGLFRVRGEGYPVNRTASAFDAGLFGGVRAGLRWGGFALWIGFGASGWLRKQELTVGGVGAKDHADRLEALAEIGGTMGLFP